MKKYAIKFTKENVSVVADSLTYDTAESLLEDYGYMFDSMHPLVLGMDELSNGVKLVSYVKTESYFYAVDPDAVLNDHTFTLLDEF